jgi:hypothetical protein
MVLKKNGAILGRLHLEIRKRHYINCCTLDSPTHTVPRAVARVSALRSSGSCNRHTLTWVVHQMDYIPVRRTWTSTKKGVSSCKTKITLYWEHPVSYIVFFPLFKFTSSCSYFEHSYPRYLLLTPKINPHALVKCMWPISNTRMADVLRVRDYKALRQQWFCVKEGFMRFWLYVTRCCAFW